MIATPARRASDDSGLSLIEVIVAISVILVVATASTSLFISGLKATNAQEQRQAAVTIAADLLGDVGGLAAAKNPSTGTSGLVVGRSLTAVTSQWTSNTGVAGVAQTYPAWDPSPGATVAVPLTGSITRSGSTYATQVIIGSCYQRQRTGGQCTLIPGLGSAPSLVPSGYSQLMRVIVTVRWGTGNLYQVTTLIDPGTDVAWVTSG